MIFIGGIQPKRTRLEGTPRTCQSCGSQRAYFERVDHFLSIFFIPVLPIKRGVAVIRCENCGAVVAENGQSLWTEGIQGPRRCPQCGRMMEENFLYCPHCGI